MIIIPAIDLRNGHCVRLTQGRRSDETVYDEDPVSVAVRFAEAGAEMIHIVDLDGAFDDRCSPNREIARAIIRAVKTPIEFGGGMRARDDIAEMIDAGAARIVVGTLAVESPALLQALVDEFGERVVVGIDARNGLVATRGWEKTEAIRAIDLARNAKATGIERVVYTDISRDGMLRGVNIEQTAALAREAEIRVTASGGVTTLADIEQLCEVESVGIDSVIIGKAIYEGGIDLSKAIAVGRGVDPET